MNFSNSLNAFQESAVQAAAIADRLDAKADRLEREAKYERAAAAELRGEALAADPNLEEST